MHISFIKGTSQLGRYTILSMNLRIHWDSYLKAQAKSQVRKSDMFDGL